MGASGVDILLSSAALDAFPYAVECKNRAAIAVYKDFEQAQANAREGITPLVVIKQNRSEPLVIMTLEDFMKLT